MSTANPEDAKQVNNSEQPKPDRNRTVEPDRPDRNRTVKKANYGKTDVRYWPAKLKKRSYKGPGGKLIQIPEWQVRLFSGGREAWFNLGTPNKELAAAKARDIYLKIQAEGWDATLAQFKPDAPEKVVSATLGEFIKEVESKSGLRTRTFNHYAVCLRRIVSEAFGIKSDNQKYNYRQTGHAEWVAKVEAIKLHDLTPDLIQAWKTGFLKQFETDPLGLTKAKRTVNAYIRNAKALFSPGILEFIKDVALPDPLPFKGIKFEKEGSLRYQSQINPALLLAAAQRELATDHPEQYKILLLALGAGLRKAEIDTLTWKQIDWANKTITIERTEYFIPKTEDSEGTVDVDDSLLNELRRYLKSTPGPFVIASTQPARPGCKYIYYRCLIQFNALNQWLKKHGVTDRKAIHSLRKEFGSLVCETNGIYSAAKALRHADVQVAVRHYVAKKGRVTVGLDKLLTDGLKVVEADPTTKAQSA